MSTTVRSQKVPLEFSDVAHKRTSGLLKSLPKMGYDLNALARSCYLQGVVDTVELLTQRPWLISNHEYQPNDYQI